MSKKKVFALRLDPEMLNALQKWADDEFRSINGQIEYLLYDALRKAGRLKKTSTDSDNNGSDNSE
ncbi:MAG: Arc family DNA-binding protein [Bacteroidales bacterium]